MSTMYYLKPTPTEAVFTEKLPPGVERTDVLRHWVVDSGPLVGKEFSRFSLRGSDGGQGVAIIHVFVTEGSVYHLERFGGNAVKFLLELLRSALGVEVVDELGFVLGKDEGFDAW